MSFVPTMKVWAWIALELRHLPDFLYAIQLLNGALATLPLTDDSKERVREDIRELDYALGSIFLNLGDEELRQLEELPDILDGLELFTARAALLYTLGYAALLREDGSLPKDETDENASRIFSILASQPVARQTCSSLILHGEGRQSLFATILGMTVKITFQGSRQLTLVAEAVLGSLQAFFATVIDQRVVPHTEKFQISLIENAEVSKPAIETSALDMMATLTWPAALSLTNFQQQHEIQTFLIDVSGHVLGTTCVIDNVEGLVEKLHDDEAVHQRMAMIKAAPISYHRVASRSLSRLSDWQYAVRGEYPLQAPRPQLTLVKLQVPERGKDGDDAGREDWKITSHRALRVCSVIDVHAWDQARWSGICYVQFDPRRPSGIVVVDSSA